MRLRILTRMSRTTHPIGLSLTPAATLHLARLDSRRTLQQLQQQVTREVCRQRTLGPESIRELRAGSSPLGAAECFEAEVSS